MIVAFRIVVVLRLREPNLKLVELSQPNIILLTKFLRIFTVVIMRWRGTCVSNYDQHCHLQQNYPIAKVSTGSNMVVVNFFNSCT